MAAKRKCTGYTDEQIQSMIDMYINKGLSTRTIAKEFNTGSSTISYLLNKNGISMRKGKYTDEQIHAMVDMYVNKGLTTTSIAKKFNVGPSTIWYILTTNGITIRKASSYDRKSETAKQMIDMYNSGMTICQIADALDRPYRYVYGCLNYHKILGKKTYKYKDAIEAHINNIKNRNKSKVPNIEALVSSEVTDVIAERTAEIEKKLYDAMEIAFALTDEYEQICIERTKLLENEIQRQTDDINRQREELNERETMLKKAQKYINK